MNLQIFLINTLCRWGLHRWGVWRDYESKLAQVRTCKTCNLWQMRVKP